MNSMRKAKALELDERARKVASDYKRSEAELIEILQKMDEGKAHIDLGFASLYQYSVSALGLSEGTSYNLILVARKSRAVPELKESVQAGEMSLSNARRIAPVLTLENKSEWIEKAKALPQKKLEQELAKVFPREQVQERVVYTSESRADLRINISTELLELAKRAQDLLSQKTKRAVKLEEALETVLNEYVERHDPVKKAERAMKRKSVDGVPCTVDGNGLRLTVAVNGKTDLARAKFNTRERVKRYIPAPLKHQATLQDNGQCTFTDPQGKRCNQTRWLEIHHIKLLSKGGRHELANLRTLCAAHHKAEHLY
jgi:hypothetical protein